MRFAYNSVVVLLVITISLSLSTSIMGTVDGIGEQVADGTDLIHPAQADDNTTLELYFENATIQYGDSLDIFFGIQDNSSNYIQNVSYTLFILEGLIEGNIANFTEFNSTVLLQDTSTNFQMEYELETISIERSFLPNNYTIYFVPDLFVNGSQLMIWRGFEVIGSNEANIFATFFDINQGIRINGPFNTPLNRTKVITVRLDNLGAGNAVSIRADLSLTNPPMEFSTNTTPFEVPLISAFSAASFNFTIRPPAFGISELRLTVTYQNTLGDPQNTNQFLTIHTTPSLDAVIDDTSFVTGTSTRINVHIINFESVPVVGKVLLSSLKFSFNPIETQRSTFTPEETSLPFNALALENGTAQISVFFIFYDEEGGDELELTLENRFVEISDEPVEETIEIPNLPLITALILYGLLLIVVLLFVLRKDFRRTVINRLSSGSMDPDLIFENNKVIVDGSNIAWEELSSAEKPKIDNILLAIETLKSYGFKDITVVADAALRYQIDNPKDLDQEVKKGNVKVLPAKVDGDTFILRLSRTTGALILTNDLFKEYRDDYRFIDQRRIPYSIINGKFYLHPLYDDDNEL